MNLMFSILLSLWLGFMTHISSSFSSVPVQPVVSYVFMAVECPISQKYIFRLNDLYQRYPDMNIVGVFQDDISPEGLSAFKKRFDVEIPLIVDKDHQLAREFKAEITPEVFLVDRFQRVLYSGAIDNWFISLGRNRSAPSVHYLEEAFLSYRRGEDIKRKKTKAIGCFLEINPVHRHGK